MAQAHASFCSQIKRQGHRRRYPPVGAGGSLDQAGSGQIQGSRAAGPHRRWQGIVGHQRKSSHRIGCVRFQRLSQGWPHVIGYRVRQLAKCRCDSASYDARARVALMDEAGIYAQIVYPNVMGFGGQNTATVDPGFA